jgi:L-ascorbate metabolism protein UlaG (beta-lactamase superfamily)
MAHNPYYDGPVSDHFDGTRFFNPGHPDTDRSLADILRWRFSERSISWSPLPGRQVVPAARVDGLNVTMIGHASILVQASGHNLLIDPCWSDRASPLHWAGPKRANPPGVAFDQLPTIDTVLISHNHYDHLDIATLKRLWARDRSRIIAPLGNDRVVTRTAEGIAVETLDWHDQRALGEGIRVTLTPAQHWSARGVRDRRMALWGGFVIATPAGSVYFAGDTGYGDGAIFRDLAQRHGAPDLAILPIGAYQPRWFMSAQHVDPAEAVQIMIDVGAHHAIGIHWGTFQLTNEPMLEPRDKLIAELARRDLPADTFVAVLPGDRWTKPR